jgi:hypothetical protein
MCNDSGESIIIVLFEERGKSKEAKAQALTINNSAFLMGPSTYFHNGTHLRMWVPP